MSQLTEEAQLVIIKGLCHLKFGDSYLCSLLAYLS